MFPNYKVSEKQSCDIAAAIRDELKDVVGKTKSTEFVEEAAKLHDTGHENRLPAVLLRYGLQANVKISEAEIGLASGLHPFIRLRDFVECLDKEGKIESMLLMGHSQHDLETFWESFRWEHPGHQVYITHRDRLSSCIPFLLHADEGTTHKKKNLMILSAHPLLGWGGRRPGTQDVNFVGSTFLSRYLFSVLLGRVYARKKKKTFGSTRWRLEQRLAAQL